MTMFRNEEYPDSFQFKSHYEDEGVEIPEGAVVGLARAYLQVLKSDSDELIENNQVLVWEQGGVTQRSKK
jgi:hypothetical protein